MKRNLSTTLFVLLSLVLSAGPLANGRTAAGPAGTASASPGAPTGPYLKDEFDGSAMDATLWNIDLMTSGNRFCDASGIWQDVASLACGGATQAPPYGAVAVGAGQASVSAGTNRAFPYVWAGPPSRPSPFPATGDLVLEVRVRFDALDEYGSGLEALYWADTTPSGSNSPFPPNQEVFSIWGDKGGLVASLLGSPVAVAGAAEYHAYKVEYLAGSYYLFVDDTLVAGPTSSSLRPNTIRFGNPLFIHWRTDNWSDLSLDYVRVRSGVYGVSGRVTDGAGSPIAGITLSAGTGITATTGSNGAYTIVDLSTGTYTISPTTSGYFWSPSSRTVSVAPDVDGQDFSGRNLIKTVEPGGPVAVGLNEPLTYTLSMVGPTSDAWVLNDRIPTYTTYINGSLQALPGVVYDPLAEAISGTLDLIAGVPVTVSFGVQVEVAGTVQLHPLIVNRACIRPATGLTSQCDEVFNFTYIWPVYLSVVSQ